MDKDAPKADLPAQGSGLDYSVLGREQRIDQAIAAYKAQQDHQKLMLAGGVAAVIAVVIAGLLWRRRITRQNEAR